MDELDTLAQIAAMWLVVCRFFDGPGLPEGPDHAPPLSKPELTWPPGRRHGSRRTSALS